jgi:hypothetical protein
MKGIWPKVIGAVLCIVVGWAGSNLYHIKKFERLTEHNQLLITAVNSKELELEALRQQSQDEIANLRGMIDSANTVIASYEEDVNDLYEKTSAQELRISELLTAEVQELIDRYPTLKSYCLAKDQLIDDQKQIIFNLQRTDDERVKIIQAQGRQILLEREIASSWKTQFEDQRALRIAQEEAFSHYRRGRTGSTVLSIVGGVGLGLLGAAIAH